MSKIILSEEYGVNPSVETCTICGKEMGVVFFGTSYKDESGKSAKAPFAVCLGNICDDCKKVIEQGGIFFIEVRDGESGNNPFRTGRVVAIKEDAIKNVLMGYSKVNYIEQTVWNTLFKDAEV